MAEMKMLTAISSSIGRVWLSVSTEIGDLEQGLTASS